jgi:phenylacetate-CoA ligase
MPVEVARPVYIVQLFKKYPLAVICTYLPYLLSVLKHCEEQKLSSAELFKGLKFMLIYGDLILPPLRDLLEEKLGGCKVYELHSIPEAGGYFSECKAKAGLHVFEDYCFVEIMDPEEDKVLAPGEIGELVITSLWSRATSYIHYRSGDFASLDTSPCSCGRSHARLTIWGRKEWTLSLNGKKVYNRDVEEVLYAYPETITKCYQYGKTVEGNLLVRTAYDPEKTADKGLLKESLKKAFQERKGIKAEIELIPPEQATFYQDRRFI